MTKHGGYLDPRTCPECGKEFFPSPLTVYKLLKKGRRYTYCSYTCWRKNGGDKNKVNKTRKF